MGLKEQVQSGAQLTRDSITFADVNGSGSISLGGTYAVLSVQSSQPTRLRLYDTVEGRDNATEISRAFGTPTVPTNISLVGDYSMSLGNTIFTINPTSIGHANSMSNPLTYYRTSTAGATFKITRLLLEDVTRPPAVNTPYTENNRRLIQITSTASIAPLAYSGDSYTSTVVPTVPKTYMLISASLSSSTQMVRLRLYNTGSSISNASERTRPFAVEPSASVGLITDLILSGSNTVYFTPKIIGANLQKMGNDLSELITDPGNMDGLNTLYFYIQNIASSGPSITPTINLQLFSLED